MSDGHTCVKSDKSKEITAGDYRLILSYNILDASSAEFVIHASSTKYNPGTPFQRTSLLELLGFKKYEGCPHLDPYLCYYLILGTKDRRKNDIGPIRDNEIFHNRFMSFANNLQEIFEMMQKLHGKLQDAGISLPYANLTVRQVQQITKEELYDSGDQYYFWRNLLNKIQQARNEVFIIDAYADETLFDEYVSALHQNVKVKLLTKKPQGVFKVAMKKYSQNNSNFEAKSHNDVHDRFVFVDDTCWVLGGSIRHGGNKPTYIIELKGKDKFYTFWTNYYSQATSIS